MCTVDSEFVVACPACGMRSGVLVRDDVSVGWKVRRDPSGQWHIQAEMEGLNPRGALSVGVHSCGTRPEPVGDETQLPVVVWKVPDPEDFPHRDRVRPHGEQTLDLRDAFGVAEPPVEDPENSIRHGGFMPIEYDGIFGRPPISANTFVVKVPRGAIRPNIRQWSEVVGRHGAFELNELFMPRVRALSDRLGRDLTTSEWNDLLATAASEMGGTLDLSTGELATAPEQPAESLGPNTAVPLRAVHSVGEAFAHNGVTTIVRCVELWDGGVLIHTASTTPLFDVVLRDDAGTQYNDEATDGSMSYPEPGFIGPTDWEDPDPEALAELLARDLRSLPVVEPDWHLQTLRFVPGVPAKATRLEISDHRTTIAIALG
jgi:hypothetical protein